MLRATALFLLAGGVALLVTWGVRPAESQSSRTVPRTAASSGDFPAELNEVNLELDRLSAHLDRLVVYPAPARDLFHFVSRSRPLRELPPQMDVPAVVQEVPRPVWPELVAIMARPEGGRLDVALTDRAGELQVVSAGATLGEFVVTEITADAVVLTDQPSGQTTRLTIR